MSASLNTPKTLAVEVSELDTKLVTAKEGNTLYGMSSHGHAEHGRGRAMPDNADIVVAVPLVAGMPPGHGPTLKALSTTPHKQSDFRVAHQRPRCHKDPASLLAAGKWMSAPELVHVIDTAWTLTHAELDLQQEGATVQTSRQLHDAALAGVTLSHLPPIRLSCIRALVAPS
ncbi:TPA: hypothetical protein ACH3X1_007071 [Trebouxia sp. C0004]